MARKSIELIKRRVRMNNDLNVSNNVDLPGVKLATKNLKARFGKLEVLKGINLIFPENKVTAIMGPSGCGKTTLIRCLNRIHELTPNAKVEGEVILDGINIYSPKVDPVAIRRRIGMVFQKANPFPTMSIYDNAVAGLKLAGVRNKELLDRMAEKSLRMAFLWDEVKNDIKKSGTNLSVQLLTLLLQPKLKNLLHRLRRTLRLLLLPTICNRLHVFLTTQLSCIWVNS